MAIRLCGRSRAHGHARKVQSRGNRSGNHGGSPPKPPGGRKRTGSSGDGPDFNWRILAGAGAAQLLFAGDAHALFGGGKKEEAGKDIDIDVITNIGLSALMGFCAAKALKMVSTILAVLIGATFLVMQYARESGWRWKDIERKFNRTIEKNELTHLDAPGLRRDARHGLEKLTASIPNVGGFLAGFAFGCGS